MPPRCLPGPWRNPEDPPHFGFMNPLRLLLGAAASHGLFTCQIVFSTAFVGACELPSRIEAPREVHACRTCSPAPALFFPSGSPAGFSDGSGTAHVLLF